MELTQAHMLSSKIASKAALHSFPQPSDGMLPFGSGLKRDRDGNGSDLETRGFFGPSRTDPSAACLLECGNDGVNMTGNVYARLNHRSLAGKLYQHCYSGMALQAAMARGGRGAFTAEQWIELQKQLFLFERIAEGVSIPPALVASRRRTAAAHDALASILEKQPRMADPEPSRCRRTDGKKWRCAKGVVPGQKYCEKHTNRGRNRSRKLLQPSSNITSPSSSVTSNPSHEASTVCKPSTNTAASEALNVSCSQQEDIKNLSSPFHSFLSQDLASPAIGHRLLTAGDLGLSPELLPTPIKQNITSMLSYGLPYQLKPFVILDASESKRPPDANSSMQPFQQLFHLEDHRIGKGISKTSLSISVPTQVDHLGISCNGSSQTATRPVSSCLKLCMERDGMDSSMGSISWETTLGGPLGEVLQSSTPRGNKIGLNLLEGWDGSPQASSGAPSPTDVICKPIFGSYSDSNSSASSSSIRPAPSSALLH